MQCSLHGRMISQLASPAHRMQVYMGSSSVVRSATAAGVSHDRRVSMQARKNSSSTAQSRQIPVGGCCAAIDVRLVHGPQQKYYKTSRLSAAYQQETVSSCAATLQHSCSCRALHTISAILPEHGHGTQNQVSCVNHLSIASVCGVCVSACIRGLLLFG
jgi:hypothetical protein